MQAKTFILTNKRERLVLNKQSPSRGGSRSEIKIIGNHKLKSELIFQGIKKFHRCRRCTQRQRYFDSGMSRGHLTFSNAVTNWSMLNLFMSPLLSVLGAI